MNQGNWENLFIDVNILGKNYFLTFTVCTSSNIKDLWPGGSRTSGTVASITNFLGNSFADSDGELFMDRMTFLSWHLVTLFQRLVPADLVRNVSADLSRNISACMLGHILAHRVRHLPLLGLGHLLAFVVGVVLAGAGDGDPDLVVAVSLPLVLAVLLVLGRALRLGVRLVLGLVLVHADVLVDRGALLLVDGVALLSGGWLTLSLKHCLADVVILGDALLGLLLLVLGVPDGGVLGPALHAGGPAHLLGWTTRRRLDPTTILWRSAGQASYSDQCKNDARVHDSVGVCGLVIICTLVDP